MSTQWVKDTLQSIMELLPDSGLVLELEMADTVHRLGQLHDGGPVRGLLLQHSRLQSVHAQLCTTRRRTRLLPESGDQPPAQSWCNEWDCQRRGPSAW